MPTRADRYERLHLLGEGAMGRVWLARDTVLGRDVALKAPRGDAGSSSARRLQREARVLSRLDHPGIIALLDEGELPDGRPFFVMRQATGMDLERWSRGNGSPPSLARRLWTVRAVVAAVAHAHARGVIHRDLKPSNVRVDADGTVSVLDWGLARFVDESASDEDGGDRSLTRVGARLGTPAWMSPEQAAGEEAGPEADVWSLGVLLWEVLTSRRAYPGSASATVLSAVLSGPPAPVREVARDVPEPIGRVLEGALTSRHRRYADAGALLDALDSALPVLDRAGPGVPAGVWWLAAGLAVPTLLAAMGSLPVDVSESDTSPDPALVQALLAAGDRSGAESAACALLEQHPADPIARGALLSAIPRAQVLWTAPAPDCSIGEALRWDGRLLACASDGTLSVYTIDLEGMRPAWSRDLEVHQLAFMGTSTLLGQAPRSSTPQRLRVGDGRPAPISSHLTDAILDHSRSDHVARGATGHTALREDRDDRRTRTAEPAYSTFEMDALPIQVVVLHDGRELWLTDEGVERRNLDGTEREVWTVPAAHDRPARMAVSAPEHHVLVLTNSGQASALDLRDGSWSPWANVDLIGAWNLAISPDGRTAAGTVMGEKAVWSTEVPAARRSLPDSGSAVAFLDDQHLVTIGFDEVSAWRLPSGLGHDVYRAEGPLRGLAWSQVGLVGWWSGGARLWRPDGSSEAPGPVQEAAPSPDASALALALGDRGLAIRSASGTTTWDGLPCERVVWPEPSTVVCTTVDDGPHRIDVETGAVDRSASLGRQRWYALSAQAGRVALMDWDTQIFELDDEGLHHRATVPWATRPVLATGGESLLLNGRRGVVARRWRDDPLGHEDVLVSPNTYRSHALAVSPDGSRLAATQPGGGFRVDRIDPPRPEVLATSGRPKATALAWSPDGRRLAVGDATGLVRLFDLHDHPCPGQTGHTPAQ